MATGPSHYVEAEQLLDASIRAAAEGAEIVAARMTARAQVHATLALAAAAAMAAYDVLPDLDCEAWDKACGEQEDEPEISEDGPPSDCICDTDPENCPSKGEYIESGSDGAL